MFYQKIHFHDIEELPDLLFLSYIYPHFFYLGTESCIRLVDVDGDGLLDIIMGLALGKDVSSMITESSMGQFCKELGKYKHQPFGLHIACV